VTSYRGSIRGTAPSRHGATNLEPGTHHPVRETAHALTHRLYAGVTAQHHHPDLGLREHVGHIRDAAVGHIRDAAAETFIEADARAAYSKDRLGAWKARLAERVVRATPERVRTMASYAAHATRRNRRPLAMAAGILMIVAAALGWRRGRSAG
jgi:hypothetical protein